MNPDGGTLEKLLNNRWFWWGIFFLWNLCLDYIPLNPSARPALTILALAFPFFMGWEHFRQSSGLEKKPLSQKEVLDSPQWVSWLILGIVAVGLRFWHLESFNRWPTLDEALFGLKAFELSHHWDGHLFFGFGQESISLPWLCSLTYRFSHSVFFSLWFPSAFFSLITVPCAWLASRTYFSRSFSWLFTLLMALSYWPLFTGRICLLGVLLLPWELMAFYFLGRYLQSMKSQIQYRWAMILGFWTGGGYWTFTSWPSVTLVVMILMAVATVRIGRSGWRGFLLFCTSMGFALLPLMQAVLTGNYARHIQNVAAWSGYFPWSHQIGTVANYLSAPFWGTWDMDTGYAPVDGGFLNPIVGACCFLGMLEWMSEKPGPVTISTILILGILSLPALLSMNLDTFRLVQLAPFLLLLAAFGLQSLARATAPGHRKWILGLILISTALDWGRLNYPNQDPAIHPEAFALTGKSFENQKAYTLLKILESSSGPGLVFTDFVPDNRDESLAFSVIPFNALVNPDLSSTSVFWAAFLTNPGMISLLRKEFPEAIITPLPASPPQKVSPNQALAVIPMTARTRPPLLKWLQIYPFFQKCDEQIRFLPNGESRRSAWLTLLQAESVCPRDSFLHCVLWIKILSIYGWEEKFSRQTLTADSVNLANTAAHAITVGNLTANLYNQIGAELAAQGQKTTALKAFQESLKVDPRYSLAVQNLRWLKSSGY
jgi:hypothetical protein